MSDGSAYDDATREAWHEHDPEPPDDLPTPEDCYLDEVEAGLRTGYWSWGRVYAEGGRMARSYPTTEEENA